MGGDDAVSCLQQRIVPAHGLHIHHIQSGAAHFAALQRPGKGGFLNQRPPGGVQDQNPVLHFFNGLTADNVVSGGKQRRMERDHIGFRQQRVQIHIAADGFALRAGPGAGGQHPHIQCPGQTAHRPANAAKADDAHGLPLQLNDRSIPEAEVLAPAPAAFLHRLVVVAYMTGELHQQRQRELGNGGGAVLGHVGDGDAPLCRRIRVNDIVARGQRPDVAQVRAVLHDLCAHGYFAQKYRLRVADAADDLSRFAGGPVVDGQLSQLTQTVPAQIPGIDAVGV